MTPDQQLERREHDRWVEQSRLPMPRTTVKYAACRCTTRDHGDHDRMDWCASADFAYEDGVAAFVAGFHIIRVEEVGL